MDRILQRITAMSDEEFKQKITQYRDDEVAVALRHIQDTVAQQGPLLSFSFGEFFEIMNIKSHLHVLPEEFEDYVIAGCAANDERFALAA
uniref:Uncharacterized protein n=2 Tax=Polaromonas sp. W10N TaxID=1840301 RepID=A0A2S1FIJ0_9BURK|nr:hypothetical protein pW10NP1_p003 [Polaromonas sp. W10N]